MARLILTGRWEQFRVDRVRYMTDTATAGNRIRLTTLAHRLDFWIHRGVAVLAVASGVLVLQLWRADRSFPRRGTAVASSPSEHQGQALRAPPPVRDWSSFLAPSFGASPTALAAKFRLAGTFFAEGETGVEMRKAVLDHVESRAQRIVSEGDRLDGDIRVARVLQDRVILQAGTEEVELRLTFAATSGTASPAGGEETASGTPNEAAWLGGSRTGEYRWQFSRRALLDYYQQLREDPSRLVAVFDSFTPLYGPDRQIEGYQIRVAGEENFFKAVGLQDNDIVRAANSMRMTSRRRAEYLIREFLADRANVFVLDIERNGQALKLIYEVRPDGEGATTGTEGGTDRPR